MRRDEWYLAYILAVMACAALFDGSKIGGTICLVISILIVVACDGFGVKL